MKPITTRRSFFWKAGAAVCVPFAAASSAGTARDGEDMRARLALLEDLDAIRKLNRAYLRYVDAGERRQALRLFADPARAAIRDDVAGVRADQGHPEDVIEMSADRTIATARMHCTVRIEAPIEPACPLVEMARAQGGGVVKRSESGVFETVCVKHGGTWKLSASSYRPA